MTRTDVHSPTNLVTEDYEYAGCYDAAEDQPPLGNYVGVHPPGQCDHCGARLRYVALLHHLPTDGLIEVGETYLDNRFSQATEDFQRMRAAAASGRQRLKWVKAHQEVCDFIQAQSQTGNEFYSSLLQGLRTYGSLTAGQLAAAEKNLRRANQVAAIKTQSSPPATEKQISLINSLMEERSMGIEARRYARAQLDAGLTKAQASKWITRLFELPKISDEAA